MMVRNDSIRVHGTGMAQVSLDIPIILHSVVSVIIGYIYPSRRARAFEIGFKYMNKIGLKTMTKKKRKQRKKNGNSHFFGRIILTCFALQAASVFRFHLHYSNFGISSQKIAR